MVMGIVLVVALGIATVVSVLGDSRKFRIGLYLTAALMFAVMTVLGAGLGWLVTLGPDAPAWGLLGLIAVIVVVVVWLGVALVLNGFTMVRRERRTLGNLLSLLLGIAILCYLVVAVTALAGDMVSLFLAVALTGLPVGYLAFGFVSYLLYSALYQWGTKRFARPADAIVILGSGLISGEVPPLLASRLDRGLAVYRQAVAKGREPVIVASGGKGSDETRAEADAMAEYLVDHGVDAAAIIPEDRSRNTEQNLANTAAILTTRGIGGDVAVVTNNFHAFRGALLMRKAKIPGFVLGSPTAGYYWPSATIREYVAILRDHRTFNIIALGLICVPLVIYVTAVLVNMVSLL